MRTTLQRVVIVGGGFGGVKCAKRLRRRLSSETFEITLFNRENHMVFHPLLPEVAGASINPDAVAAPLRQMLAGVRCRTETVRHIDLANNRIEYEAPDGHIGDLTYDHIVIACGRSASLGAVPGMSDHAFPFKGVGDAMALRSHVIQQLENAEVCGDETRRRWYLSFVVVGAGFSGVEVAGEINDLVRTSRPFYPNVSPEDITVTLVSAKDHILPELNPDLRAFARQKMETAGITIVVNARATSATAEGVWLHDDRQLRGATVVSTVGSSTPPLVERMDTPKHGGLLATDADMRLPGRANAWAIGDCARIVNSFDGQFSPATGQFAERQGRQVADNIVRATRGQATLPFRFRPLGQFCAIGGRSAVAEVLGVRMAGLPAWFLWRGIYLFKLPSWSRRVKVGADWAWDLLFDRDLMNLKTDPTERVSRAYFRPGDYVFRRGDPALNFYAVEKGTLEVMRTREDGDGADVVAVLGPGDFFGEMALLERRPRSASVRARTEVEVTTLGAQVFSHVSKSLAPLQQRLAEAMRQRTTSVWTRMPKAHAILSREPLATFIEPVSRTLDVDSTFEEALQIFTTHQAETLYIVNADKGLAGVLTRTDLLRTVDMLATPATLKGFRPVVGSFMSADPIAVELDDSAATAAVVMWGRGLKSLPVVSTTANGRRLVGVVRAETMMQAVLQRVTYADPLSPTVPTPSRTCAGGRTAASV